MYLCHALVLIHGHKLVTHAMNQKDGHSELSMVDLIPLRPVLATHHGTQDKWRHIEGISLLQQLLFFGTLTGKSSSKDREARGGVTWNARMFLNALTHSNAILSVVREATTVCVIISSGNFGTIYKCSSYLRKLHAKQGDRQ